jgi:hypothetical protein
VTSFLAALQQPVIGVLLLWAGLLKVVSAGSAQAANASALPVLLRREALAAPAYRVVGGVETAVALLLLLPPASTREMAAAVALSGLFVGYLSYARRATPQRPCGCLGGHDTPLSTRTQLRAGLLCAASVLGLAGSQHWTTAVADQPALSAAVLGLEAVVLAVVSPELRWDRARRALQAALPSRGLPADCTTADVAVDTSLRQLEQSEPYHRLEHLLVPGVQDHWRDGCWRFLSYSARYDGLPATAVFAVPLIDGTDWIRAAVTEPAGETVLLTVEPRAGDASVLGADRASTVPLSHSHLA